jgi:hypothetical protein
MAIHREGLQRGSAVELSGREVAAIDEPNERAMRRATRGLEQTPAPLQFDAQGFPIPQPLPGFVQRVGRLIHGS